MCTISVVGYTWKSCWHKEWRKEMQNYILESIALFPRTKVTVGRFKLVSNSLQKYKKRRKMMVETNLADGKKATTRKALFLWQLLELFVDSVCVIVCVSQFGNCRKLWIHLLRSFHRQFHGRNGSPYSAHVFGTEWNFLKYKWHTALKFPSSFAIMPRENTYVFRAVRRIYMYGTCVHRMIADPNRFNFMFVALLFLLELGCPPHLNPS